MRLHKFIVGMFLISAVAQTAQAQIAPRVARAAIPTYIRKFQSDRDVNRPTRLNHFAFRMAGYPAAEDRVVDHRGQWDVDPVKHTDDIVMDSPHLVRSARSQTSGPAVSAFADAITDTIDRFRSHAIYMGHPRAVTTDSGRKVIVSDPTAQAVHIFDLETNRYLRIQGGDGCRLQAPAGVAVDAAHNIYVTDAELGVILVYDKLGRFQRYIGKRDNQEGGIFYRPSSIAIDQHRDRIYVPDTSRHMIVVMDLNGKQLD